MNTLKRILLVAMLLLALSLQSSRAQNVNYFGTLTGGTNMVAASSTANPSGQTVTLLSSRYVSVQPSFALMGAGTSATTFRLDISNDGLIWSTNVATLTVVAAGTVNVNTNVVVDSGGALFLRVGQIVNGSASNMTNVMVTCGRKVYL